MLPVQSNGKMIIRNAEPEQGQVMKLLFKHFILLCYIRSLWCCRHFAFNGCFLSITCLWGRNQHVNERLLERVEHLGPRYIPSCGGQIVKKLHPMSSLKHFSSSLENVTRSKKGVNKTSKGLRKRQALC